MPDVQPWPLLRYKGLMLDLTRAYGLNFLFPERDSAVGKCLRDHGEFAPAEVALLSDYINLVWNCKMHIIILRMDFIC